MCQFQVAGRATQFDAWILVSEPALAASGQMRVPATALSKRTLAAMTWKLIAARLKPLNVARTNDQH